MKWITAVIFVLSAAAFFYLGVRYHSVKQRQTVESSAVLLERIKEVIKLSTVEAQFSELYSHKEFQWFDLSPFRKSAIIRVQATVSAGIQLDSSHFKIDEQTKELHLSAHLDPRILYIDHQLDYYDMQQGSFNEFTAEDMSRLQQNAKDLIRKKAIESDLLSRAEGRKQSMLSMLNQVLDLMSYKLVIEDQELPLKH